MHHSLIGYYDMRLVALSVVIATIAAYTALNLAERITSAKGSGRLGWLFGGATAMGLGIWSMHFIGMLAYVLPIPTYYDLRLVIVSVLPAILASGFALWVVSREAQELLQITTGSLLMGAGIGAMHYIGMAALRVPGALHYHPIIVGMSVAVAIAISLVALFIIFHVRTDKSPHVAWKRLGAAVVLGAAIPTTHYVGMAGVTVTADEHNLAASAKLMANPTLVAIVVSLGTLIVLGLALLTSFFDHRIAVEIGRSEILQEKQKYLETLLEGIKVGVLVLDGTGRVCSCNQSALKLLALTSTELLNQWQDKTHRTHPVLRAISGQQSLENAVVSISKPENQENLWLLINGVLQYDPDEKLQQIIYTFSDITELKQIEESLRTSESRNRALAEVATAQAGQIQQTLQQLRQTQSQLIQQEKMSSLGQIVAGIAHEINNPINFIHGNLKYLKQYTQNLIVVLDTYQKIHPKPTGEIRDKLNDLDYSFVSEDFIKLINSIQNGSQRIRHVVTALRNFSRLDESEYKEVNLHEGLENALLFLQHRLSKVKVVKSYGSLPLVECYAAQLNQVFFHILSNAIDALEDFQQSASVSASLEASQFVPKIQIRTEFLEANDSQESQVQIQFINNGSAIPDAIKAQIFNPFFTTKTIGKGAGLGLAVAYQVIVQQHKGLLQCFSELDQDTEFRIRIPIKKGYDACHRV